ncbi:UPF0481 protein At3g47200-like [Humulus lupulus]|uniref:UPF0481 protein At3g47200-like n=1 Tax=Humulus lupulus TaxID=3486 RepID=UPI002B4035E8|nr:UPF0481 protein At3g47200-like [Humulus lupulus]
MLKGEKSNSVISSFLESKLEGNESNDRKLDNYFSDDCVMFRVPKILRQVDEEAYTPRMVSIGPFHYGDPSFKEMQSHKENYYFQKFLARTANDKKRNEKLSEYEGAIKGVILSKYEGAITSDLNHDKFTEVILIDSCFIIELLALLWENIGTRKKDSILKTPLLFNTIKLDLLMLENQIPFSFLKDLYDKFWKPANGPTFLELAKNFFGISSNSLRENDIKHFTDLYRMSFLPRDWVTRARIDIEQYDVGRVQHVCSATKLDKAGVDFCQAPEEDTLLMITVPKQEWWRKGIPCLSSLKLQVPQFTIGDGTEYIMRNVMALEQCKPDPDYKFPICDYIYLMNDLIDSEKDVDLLVEKKVIKHFLGSNKEVADIINKLGKNISLANNKRFIYNSQCNKLNQFNEYWLNRSKATFKRIYFKDVWTGSSTVVGVFVLIFTIVSSFCSIWSFVKDNFGSANQSILSFSY